MSFLPRRFSYSDMGTWPKIKEQEITLPVLSSDSDVLDFAFMEQYIYALEQERIRTLEQERIRTRDAYLKVAGLDNTELAANEITAVNAIKTARTADFKVGGDDGLFDVKTPPKRFNANRVQFGGDHPYVVRRSQNNGQRGCIIADESYLSEGKTISFGQDTATIFYQERPYFTGDKIKVMKFQLGDLDERKSLFLLAVMRKAFSNFRWGSSSFDEKILKGVVVELPITSSGAIDLNFIDTFIRAVMKQCIADVVMWKDHEIAATQSVVLHDNVTALACSDPYEADRAAAKDMVDVL